MGVSLSVGVHVCRYTCIWIGGITFSQPDLTKIISAQFLSLVHIRNRWIPQVCKILIWDPLIFSHHNKLILHHYVHYSSEGMTIISLSCILSLRSKKPWWIRKPYRGCTGACRKIMLFKRTLPSGIVTVVVSAFLSRIIFINNFYSHIWLRSVYYSVNSI